MNISGDKDLIILKPDKSRSIFSLDDFFQAGFFRPWILAAMVLLTGCGTPRQLELMPTPVLFDNVALDPFKHLTPEQKTSQIAVFYATGRDELQTVDGVHYGNQVDSLLHFGTATVEFGAPALSWPDLYRVSLLPERPAPVSLQLLGTQPMASMAKVTVPDDPDSGALTAPPAYTLAQQPWLDRINRELARSRDQELMVYVHGTKVDFRNAVSLTAEINHFAGRDFVSLAYDWPSHQNILEYVVGIDKQRAINASYQLKNLLLLLADHTNARRINVVCYSAGGRVMSRALQQLWLERGSVDTAAMKARLRLGTVLFAASDVEVDRFLDRLPAIAHLTDQTVITVSDADDALRSARMLMGGDDRIGTMKAEMRERQFVLQHHLNNVQIVDVSRHKEVRGFDIEGHHYWYRHPWMSSDMLLLLRTNLPPAQRALTASEEPGIWYFAADYPERVRQQADQALDGRWHHEADMKE